MSFSWTQRLSVPTASPVVEMYSKICVKPPLSKRLKIAFQEQSSLNAGQKNCRMLQGKHSAILSTFIKLPFVKKNFFLSISEWPFYTGCTVLTKICWCRLRCLDQFWDVLACQVHTQ